MRRGSCRSSSTPRRVTDRGPRLPRCSTRCSHASTDGVLLAPDAGATERHDDCKDGLHASSFPCLSIPMTAVQRGGQINVTIGRTLGATKKLRVRDGLAARLRELVGCDAVIDNPDAPPS